MASAQVVETSVTNNSPSQDCNHPYDLFQSRYIIFILIPAFTFQIPKPSYQLCFDNVVDRIIGFEIFAEIPLNQTNKSITMKSFGCVANKYTNEK